MEKPIKDFENYTITSEGKVLNSKRKELSIWKDNVGYLQVILYKNNKKYYKRIHRLVAEAFIPNPTNLPQVNHINGDKTKNTVDNLEWIDNKNNTQHGYDNNLYHSKHRNIKIEVYDKITHQLIDTYKSIRETANELNINRKTLSRILFDNKENNYDYDFKAII